MKKFISITIALLIIGVLFLNNPDVVKAALTYIRSGSNVPSGVYAMQTSASTTTPNYLQNGLGTTTLTFPSDTFKALAINENVFASTTNTSVLSMEVQSSDNGIDFFTYDPTLVNPARTFAATSTTALASSTVTFQYQPSTIGATTTKSFLIPLIPAKFTRIIWTVPATSTPSTTWKDGYNLWANVIGVIQ